MNQIGIERASIQKIIERLHGRRPRQLRLHLRPLRGGLDSLAVLRVTASFRDRRGRRRISNIVAKRLQGSGAREAVIYQQLVTEHAQELAPRLLGVDHQSDGQSVLYLECVRPVRSWPWRNLETAEHLIGALARLHMATAATDSAASLPAWDYEAELKRSSETVLELLARCRHSDFSPLACHMPSVRRLTLALPVMRRELLAFSPFGNVAIHGDVHPGNVLVRRRAVSEQAILIDWGRARAGSPLEDLSSWLQSLGYWEPRVRLRHDTLLAAYLSARGMERRLSSELRATYWLAGASNAFSGALEYYLRRVVGPTHGVAAHRQAAAHSASDWLRIVRRAAMLWN
jgi:hypothetical protein